MSEWDNTTPVEPEKNRSKESRWWMVYHFWGGICLKTYFDVSGLSKYILGNPGGSDPASASSYATSSAALAVGAVAIGYYLSKALLTTINGGNMSKNVKTSIKFLLPFAYFVAAMLLTMVTAPLMADNARSNKVPSSASTSGVKKPVMAFTTTQSSEGVTEASFDQEGLQNLEKWIVDTMLRKGRAKYAELGYNPKDYNPKISANSVYITAKGKKLAVIKINAGNSVRSVTIIGINGASLERVTCLRGSNHDIPMWSGECGKEINKTFGVSIEP